MNRRITKTTGGTTTIFLYDIYNNLIGEYDAFTGNTNKEYIYLGSKPLAMITDPVSSSSSGCGSINTGCSTTGLSLRNGYSMKTGMGAVDGFIYLFPLIGIAIIRIGRNAKRRKLDIIGLLVISGMVILIVMVSRQTHAQVTGETIYYYHLDHLGTPIEMTDANQNVVWQASYDPFGQATISESTVTNNLRFSGMYSDSETGLYFNMNRYYYPSIGRYIEPDPFNVASAYINLIDMIHYRIQQAYMTGYILSSNEPINVNLTNKPYLDLLQQPSLQEPYVYSLNNPVNYMDPTGLYCIYSQSTGEIVCVNDTTSNPYLCGKGYSGNNAGYNNPNMQGVPFMGPIPQGPWVTSGPSSSQNTGKGAIHLSPLPGNSVFDVPRNDSSFWAHGHGPNGSEGCIILPPNIRRAIPSGEIINVVPDNDSYNNSCPCR